MDRTRLGSLFDLSGRVVIVTGGTRGIGRSEQHLRARDGEALGVPTQLAELRRPVRGAGLASARPGG